MNSLYFDNLFIFYITSISQSSVFPDMGTNWNDAYELACIPYIPGLMSVQVINTSFAITHCRFLSLPAPVLPLLG